jgi:predicted transcriptional regulator
MAESENDALSLELVSKIVSAYVSKNSLPPGDLPQLIKTVHEALKSPGQAGARPEPAVSIKQSVKPEYIVCLDDGKKLKMLKRHLRAAYNMSPDEYRKRWGLPSDYPMVAPKYAAKRSELAKKIGLGRKAGSKVKGKRVVK